MFLNQLSYQEKKMFLDLSIHIAKSNNELAAEEKALISSYCTEMQLPPIEVYSTEPFETVTSYFALADIHVKKIVVLEIFGLAYVDGDFDNDEIKIIKKFSDDIGITDEIYSELHDAIKEYYLVCKKLAVAVE